jgi:uncharacterized repeat protein (TIGR04138 family)
MPPGGQIQAHALLRRAAENVGVYPLEAYEFVHKGVAHTVQQIHGPLRGAQAGKSKNRHVTGQQLCWGLRNYAHGLWGMMATTVLTKWGITCTLDFGRIVFGLVEHQVLCITEQDRLDDFRNVFEFKTAFAADYRMTCKI